MNANIKEILEIFIGIVGFIAYIVCIYFLLLKD
jgi:hypothetical protein